MFKVQTLNKIDQAGLQRFPLDKYEIASELPFPDAIILRSFNMHGMSLPSSLKAIARAGAGVNNIPVEECTENGIVVFNTPGANANAVKELVIAGLLIASRNIISGIEWVESLRRGSEENDIVSLVEKGKSNFLGSELRGKTLAIIGLGAIGVMVANVAQALDMRVIGYDPYISVENAWGLHHNIKRAEGIEVLLSNADFVSLQMPLTDATRHFINKDKIGMMKAGTKVLNFARGELVANDDMGTALENGKVSCYVTDFPDADILKMKNAITIPHLGASTSESEVNCSVMAIEQTRDYLENGNIRNSVNFPLAEMNERKGARILIANKNIPNMVGQISTLLAGENVNIANMLNKNRNDIAYNIIDIDRPVLNPAILDRLRDIDGVIMGRVLQRESE